MAISAAFNATSDRKERLDSNVVTVAFSAATESADRSKLRRMAGQLGKRFGQNNPGE